MKSKNIIKFLIAVFLATLIAILIEPQLNKNKVEPIKEYSGLTQEQLTEELSEDDSLDTIEKELEDTEIEDFEGELDSLDEDINQL